MFLLFIKSFNNLQTVSTRAKKKKKKYLSRNTNSDSPSRDFSFIPFPFFFFFFFFLSTDSSNDNGSSSNAKEIDRMKRACVEARGKLIEITTFVCYQGFSLRDVTITRRPLFLCNKPGRGKNPRNASVSTCVSGVQPIANRGSFPSGIID